MAKDNSSSIVSEERIKELLEKIQALSVKVEDFSKVLQAQYDLREKENLE